MTRLKDFTRNNRVHERRLEMTTYSLEDDRVLVEGWLKDDCFVQRYSLDETMLPPGKIHRICVRMLVGGKPISILDAEAEMPCVPHEECLKSLDMVKKIIGLTIVHGYTKNVEQLLGGVNGCMHMASLITAMGTAAAHGYWFNKLQHPPKGSDKLDVFPHLRHVINTCMLWQKDGPLVRKIRNTLNKSGVSLDEILDAHQIEL